MNEAILKHRDGPVRVLSINDRAARNALTPELYAALAAALAEAKADPGTGSIVLTGVGIALGSGSDLNHFAQRRAMAPLEKRRTEIEGLHGVICSIRRCGKPVIAAVEGSAAGAGLSIALACDMLVAARNASFPASHLRVGLSRSGRAATLLSEVLSWRVLTEPGLKGGLVTGERMHGLGVVNRLAEPGGALTEAISMAVMFASGPQLVISRIKALSRLAGENTLEAQLELEARHVMGSVGIH